jgi:integrase
VVLPAYYTGMRKSEIIHLSWDEVDLEKGFIRLHADRVKTKVARSIPLHPRVKQMLERQPRGLHSNRVFLRNGKPFAEIKKSFRTACQKPGLTDFTFYDLRHCALNNMRLAGNDYFRIMAISGNKTMAVFRRDNFVTKEELNQVRWLDSLMDTRGEVDTYMDTKRKRAKR